MTQAKGSERTRCPRCGGNGPLTKAGRCAPCTVDLQIQPTSKPTAPPSTAPEGVAEWTPATVAAEIVREDHSEIRIEWLVQAAVVTAIRDIIHSIRTNANLNGTELGDAIAKRCRAAGHVRPLAADGKGKP